MATTTTRVRRLTSSSRACGVPRASCAAFSACWRRASDCQQVLTQLAAVKAAVDQVGLHLMSERLRTCMADGGGDCAEQFEDAVSTFLRFATLAR